MKTVIVVAALAAVSLSGCASMYKQRVNQDLWEREMRLEEDCIYKLRWQLEDCQRELAATKQQLATNQKESDVLRGGSTAPPDLSAPPGILGPATGGGSQQLPPAPRLPTIEPGIEAPGAPSGAPPQSSIFRGSNGSVSQASYNADEKNPLRPAPLLDANAEVERIDLNPGLTGGTARGGHPGDELLSVAIEQRDSAGKRVLAPGDVTIVVVDPALQGSAARIARWTFDSDELARHARKNRDGGTIHFELPWPSPPEHSDLRLFVRFTTYDGRRLEANLPIEVQLADDTPGAWRRARRHWPSASLPIPRLH